MKHVKALKVEIQCPNCQTSFDVGLDEFVNIVLSSISHAKEAEKKRAAPEAP